MNRASNPHSSARARAASSAGSEKSTPVTIAPSRAQDSVSRPKWHWMCRRPLPFTSVSSSRSTGLSRDFAAWEGVPGALAHDQPGDLRTLLLGKQPDIVVGLAQLDLP